jgi:cytosine/adenosine deaminase-related metal-dependent hydrolase
MRKVAAHYVFCGDGQPVRFGIVSLEGNTVVSVSPSTENFVEAAHTEFYPGVLIPAIVNAASATGSHVWFPKDDDDATNVLTSQEELPQFAVLTPEAVAHLSADTIASIYNSMIAIALGNATTNHPTVLFRMMVHLAEKLPEIPFHDIVKMATSNGAAALQQKQQGAIVAGYQPGIYHISGFCFTRKTIDQHSTVEVIAS